MAGIRDRLAEFLTFDTEVLAISCDPVYSLRAFADQDGLNFPLLSDFWPHGEVTRAYDVFDERKGCPRRSSYVIDKDGMVRWAVHNAKPEGRDLDEHLAQLQGAGLDRLGRRTFRQTRDSRLNGAVYISHVEPLVTRDASGSTLSISRQPRSTPAIARIRGRRGDRTPDIFLVREALYR